MTKPQLLQSKGTWLQDRSELFAQKKTWAEEKKSVLLGKGGKKEGGVTEECTNFTVSG